MSEVALGRAAPSGRQRRRRVLWCTVASCGVWSRAVVYHGVPCSAVHVFAVPCGIWIFFFDPDLRMWIIIVVQTTLTTA